MAEIKAEICRIESVSKHPNADALDLVQVKGWNCVVKSGSCPQGSLCLYIPIDACIPKEVEEVVFKGVKVSLTNGRIKAIRIRQIVSQGLVVDPSLLNLHSKAEGYDATAELGITKYEPPEPAFQGFNGGGKNKVRVENPYFKKYTSIEHLKNHWKVFEPADEVYVTEKLHGTNWRAGYVVRLPVTNLEKLWLPVAQRFFESFNWQFMVGSHNVQLRPEENNLYCNVAKHCGLKHLLGKGIVLYGEVIGPNIQKNYSYGLTADCYPRLVLFDVQIAGVYQSFETVQKFANQLKIDCVPVLASGQIQSLKLDELVQGPSAYSPLQKVKEGIVIRPMHSEQTTRIGRKILKYINPEYLMLKDNTDYH